QRFASIGTWEARMSIAMTRALLVGLALSPVAALAQQAPKDPFLTPYVENCAVCHGANLEGAAQGTPLAGTALRHGESVDEIAKSIAGGFPQTGMPAWSATMDATVIRRLAIFVSEKRSELGYTDFKVAAPPTYPKGTIETEKQA